jgi:hypothetical protein
MPRALIAIGLAAGMLLSGCGGTRLITGTITIYDTNQFYDEATQSAFGPLCYMGEGYRDIEISGNVTVKDGAGTIIGTSELEKPTSVKATSCEYPFAVTVSDSEFYSIKIGNRRELIYSRAELESQGWTLGLTLRP